MAAKGTIRGAFLLFEQPHGDLPPPTADRPMSKLPTIKKEAYWRWVEPPEFTGDGTGAVRLRYRQVVLDDGLDDELRRDMRHLRALGLYDGPLLGDELTPPVGATRRGVPADYDGTDARLCNARTRTGRPCRALALPSGRCKWHGGMSTGPKTAGGKARSALNLIKARETQTAKRRT